MENIAKQASSIIGNINYFGKSLQGNFFGGSSHSKEDEKLKKSQTMRIPKMLAQNIIFNTISNFMTHFINFKYSLE